MSLLSNSQLAEAYSNVYDSVISILSGNLLGGRELAARVIAGGIDTTEKEVFDVLDEMLQDQTVIFDAEADEWRLA